MSIEHLRIVLGDQLDPSALDGLEPEHDALWMAEVHEETTHVWCHKQRLLMFLSAMRHFRDARRDEGFSVHYRVLAKQAPADEPASHEEALTRDLQRLRPKRVSVLEPGDRRVRDKLVRACRSIELDLEIVEDPHFLCTIEAFEGWMKGRKSLLLEHFYRWMRKRSGILMTDGKPTGGAWNYDHDNRKSFGKKGPGSIPPLPGHRWDALTREVAELIEARFSDHPGRLDTFDLPVTPEEAKRLADHFIDRCLPEFGKHQDAMWSGDVILWHSRLSAPMNLKLVDPRYLLERAERAYEDGHASIESVEGFIRQVLGWREFVRGIYFTHMPDYAERNALRCPDRPVPAFLWDGQTDMACVADAMKGLLEHGYVHHIHRLMVLGLLCLLQGVHPYRFHEWHMAMYLDAVDWVSLPNALGMSQYGDGGILGTKPYVATGNYIHRMSNYCGSCRYNPKEATGDAACPFTTLYWDFLDRHEALLDGNSRMALQLKNLRNKSDDERSALRRAARRVRDRIDGGAQRSDG